uniref:Uncharacterized protein n=1 Tax=Oryza punctata TaxID=4537 RepID=A0A0E0LDB4_ORYPU
MEPLLVVVLLASRGGPGAAPPFLLCGSGGGGNRWWISSGGVPFLLRRAFLLFSSDGGGNRVGFLRSVPVALQGRSHAAPVQRLHCLRRVVSAVAAPKPRAEEEDDGASDFGRESMVLEGDFGDSGAECGAREGRLKATPSTVQAQGVSPLHVDSRERKFRVSLCGARDLAGACTGLTRGSSQAAHPPAACAKKPIVQHH